mmetsp:Transcript_1456/g.1736  ORF Transcript_1456/g.1736 Transcript_1456/m.1736 type:complete len:204 (+) Transcript_1456:112-723(+)|eukprot:CAMPEP_0194364702 /NCGR_PEP_ID=MMETSP0174-20130528/12604_1 /TAXON_ID=216777 /ORGANISM="Proboscia alata, Strain PI-D3" /LENGTH=203 /DNA_ID=CAMNT_0039138869 /DNA_START=34 /DNA_END=645 /DNA_ORIENTATION=-
MKRPKRSVREVIYTEPSLKMKCRKGHIFFKTKSPEKEFRGQKNNGKDYDCVVPGKMPTYKTFVFPKVRIEKVDDKENQQLQYAQLSPISKHTESSADRHHLYDDSVDEFVNISMNIKAQRSPAVDLLKTKYVEISHECTAKTDDNEELMNISMDINVQRSPTVKILETMNNGPESPISKSIDKVEMLNVKRALEYLFSRRESF